MPGSRLGRYEVRQVLGAGAFAVVLRAWDPQLQRDVAVKVPYRFLLADESARQRFLEEARTTARLRHPRIVALYDVAESDDGTIYLVMQYVQGHTLRDALRAGPLPADQARQIAAQVASAMDVAHRAGVFHRDLKPGNILLDEQGEPHVCDFGLALQADNQRQREGECAGTWSYMAPEQIRGEAHQLDGRADIWALGVIYYELLTGRLPFEGRDRQELSQEILHRDPRPPRQFDARISRGQEAVCLRCLAKQPAHRYATAGDVADALEAGHRHRHLPRGLFLLAVMALALLLTLALGTAWVRSPSAPHNFPLPTQGTIDLLVWGPQEVERQGVPVFDARALPLRTGDRLRVSVQLNQPAFIYVLWLDARGTVLPVYPWRAGKWTERPADEQPRISVSLPPRHDAGWLMQASEDGMETLLLLVRHARLPDAVDLPSRLAHIPHQSLALRDHAAWFHDGQPVSVAADPPAAPGRPAVLASMVPIEDPLLHMQQSLAEELRPLFQLVRAVSFPVVGD
jgi:tRNA A-37 threonylcarbamoyl transferase component Bud32